MEETKRFEAKGDTVTVEIEVAGEFGTSTQKQTVSIPGDEAEVTIKINDE